MGRPGPQTFAKRQREQAKREKREAKRQKMAMRKALKKAEAEGTLPNHAEEDAQPDE